VITAGLNDNEKWSDEVGLAPRPGFDQKDVCRQFTKISWEARTPESLPLMLVPSSPDYAGMYLGDPDIDFVKLAESQSVKPATGSRIR
jgi:hypothetical protein